MSAKSLKLNPNVRVSSRNDFSEKSRTKYGDNFVGDFIATSGFAGPVIASGGTITSYTVDGVTYKSRTFTGSGTFEVTRGGKIGYLVVAGGGYFNYHAAYTGTPGAGGMLNSDNQDFGTYGKVIPKSSANYTVVVGGGGSPSQLGSSNQSLYIHTTAGGNGGYGPGGSGGSGGGASSAGEPINAPCHHGGGGIGGQGHPGGGGFCHNQCGYAPHGGGGGAGSSGGMGGAGGARASIVYDGTSRSYAGGGASPGDGGPCYPGFGGGGGEYGYGNGGPGIVVVAHRG